MRNGSAPLRAALAVALALLLARNARPAPADVATGPEMIRLGFSGSMLDGMNENDARASIKALATSISHERGLPADPDPHLLAGPDAAAAAIRQHAVNALGVTAREYWVLRNTTRFDGFLVGVDEAGDGETYVVLVPDRSPARRLADLRGHDIAILGGARMSLATIWLDVELAREQLPPATQFFSRRIAAAKPSKAVLPVFFEQVDACLVNRRTLDAMAELNPQIARRVRVIATSPGYVPSLFAIAHGLSPQFLARVLREFSALRTTPAGQQVLTIFQTGQVAARPEAVLAPTMSLLDEHARLFPATEGGLVAGAVAAPAAVSAP